MKKKLLLSVCLFLMVGCSSYIPKNEISSVDKVSNIKNSNENSLKDDNLVFTDKKWWLIYNDENLNNLMNLILAENTDLKKANLNIEKANASILGVKSSNLNVGAYAGATYHGLSKHATSTRSIKVTNPTNLPLPSKLVVDPEDYVGKPIYTAGLGIKGSYTFDFYDKYKNLTKQQTFMAKGAKFQTELVGLKLTTNITKLYAYYLYLEKENTNLKNRLTTLTSMKDKVSKGIALGVSVDQDLLKIQNQILELKTFINLNKLNRKVTSETLNSLSSYKHQEEIKGILKNATSDKILNKEFVVPSSISSDVIVNRPDVKFYLMMIKSQEAKLAVAKVNFYPQVSITGDIGFKGLGVDNGFKDFKSLMWSFGPKVYLPIFNLNGVKANYKVAGIDANIFVQDYDKTVNTAIKEINDKLTATQIAKLNYQNQITNFENNKSIYNDSKVKLRLGSISKFENLTDKYSYLDANLKKTAQAFKVFSNQIDLISSLGGVYKTKEDLETK